SSVWSLLFDKTLVVAQIHHKDTRSSFIYVTYEMTDGIGLINEWAMFIIWTTTPWTLPASLGVSLHPDLKYDVFEIDGEQYVAAHDLLVSLIDDLDCVETKIINSFNDLLADNIVSKISF